MKIFAGFDWRESEAYKVCEHSLRRHSSKPLDIEPLSAAHPYYNRTFYWQGNQRFDEVDKKPFSTDFSFARFLVPVIQGYKGWAMFVDCDFLFKADVQELFALRDEEKAVQVVQHEHQPKQFTKMDGMDQSKYPRKNWSSMVLWNCGHRAHALKTPWRGVDGEKVNTWPGAWLHNFQWLEYDEIGSLPECWNYLVSHSIGGNPKALHYTEGGPWFENKKGVEYASDWIEEREMMNSGE